MAGLSRPDYLSVGEVALALGVSEATVWRLLRARDLASVKVGGLRRISRSALTAYVARQKAGRKRARRKLLRCPHCGQSFEVYAVPLGSHARES